MKVRGEGEPENHMEVNEMLYLFSRKRGLCISWIKFVFIVLLWPTSFGRSYTMSLFNCDFLNKSTCILQVHGFAAEANFLKSVLHVYNDVTGRRLRAVAILAMQLPCNSLQLYNKNFNSCIISVSN